MLESAIHYRHAFSYLKLNDSNYKHCLITLEWENVNNISNFLACFYHVTCVFYGTKCPTSYLYFLIVSLVYVTLKQQLVSKNEYKRLMVTQMISKFVKYLLEFSVVLAIAVILSLQASPCKLLLYEAIWSY